MNQLYNSITSNLLTILIVGFLFYFFFLRKKKQTQTVQLQQQAKKEAEAIGVVIKTDGTSRSGSETEYSGQTGGIDWKLKSEVRISSQDISKQVWERTSSWRTDTVKLPVGKFLMLMSAPGYNSSAHSLKQGGFLNKLVNMAADFALDIYVEGYFGSQYKSMINVGDSIKIEKPALQGFLILTNIEPLTQKFLDDSTVNVIANWKKQKLGFTREGNVDQFGLLFSQDGVILSCQADMANAEEAKTFSDFGSVLCVKMKGIM